MNDENKKMILQKKYTLLELLVVIGIIGILCTLLFPMLKTAKGFAYETICKGNLKQIGMLEHSYIATYGWVTPSYLTLGASSTQLDWNTYWYQLLLQESGTFISLNELNKLPPKMSSAVKIFLCPRSIITYSGSNIQMQYTVSYSMYNTNNDLGRGVMPSVPYFRGAAPWNITVAKNPSSKAHVFDNSWTKYVSTTYFEGKNATYRTLGDAEYIPGAAGKAVRKGFRTLGNIAPKYYFDFFNGRHRGSANFLFLDGHVKFIPVENVANEANSSNGKMNDIGITFRPLTND